MYFVGFDSYLNIDLCVVKYVFKGFNKLLYFFVSQKIPNEQKRVLFQFDLKRQNTVLLLIINLFYNFKFLVITFISISVSSKINQIHTNIINFLT